MSYQYSKFSNKLFQYIEDLGIEKISEQEKRNIDKLWGDYPSIEYAKREIELLLAINKVLITSYRKVCVENMISLYKSIDLNTLTKLYSIYEEIKKNCKDEIAAKREFRKAVVEIMAINDLVNKEIANQMDSAFSRSLELKDSLYLTMLDVQKADILFENCRRRSKVFLKECESKNLEKIILCLKQNFKMSDDELVNISKKCASFFISSSVSKLNNLNLRIEEFKNYIKNQDVKISTAIEIDKLLKKDFKGLLSETSSVATLNSESINKTLRFLMGESLGVLANTNKELYDIRGSFTPFQLAKIYNESISSLSITVEKIKNICENIAEVYNSTYNHQLNFDEFINGNNFSSMSQLSKEDYLNGKKINEIFALLSMFISHKDMEGLLKKDFSFLIAPISAVKNSLKEAVLTSNNKDELRFNILKKIRNHFDIYEKMDDFTRKNNDSYNETSLNKIDIKSIDEETLKEVLEKLDATSEDISLWSRNWDKEEKEYRNLAVEIELEDLISQIDNAKQLLYIDYIELEKTIEDVTALKELYLELENNYHQIVDEKKLNKSLAILAEKAYNELEELREGINSHFDSIICLYSEQLETTNNELEEKRRSLDRINQRNVRRTELDELIKTRDITEEKMNSLNALIEDIEGLLLDIEKSVEVISKREREANKNISAYFCFLREEARENAMSEGLNIDVANNRKLSVLFPMFIYSLEFDELIDGADEVLGRPYNLKKVSYKTYRAQLNQKEREFTDLIYKSYVENMELKANMRKRIDGYLKKYEISSIYGVLTNDKITSLIELMNRTKKELKEDVKIVKERSKYGEDELVFELEKLMEEKEKFDSLIEFYTLQVESLRKEKIIR